MLRRTKASEPHPPYSEPLTFAMEFRTYRLCDRSDSYYQVVSKRIGRYQKCVNLQMKSMTFDGKDSIALLNFLAMFQTAFDFNGIHEGATKWLFQKLIHGAAQNHMKNRMAGELHTGRSGYLATTR